MKSPPSRKKFQLTGYRKNCSLSIRDSLKTKSWVTNSNLGLTLRRKSIKYDYLRPTDPDHPPKVWSVWENLIKSSIKTVLMGIKITNGVFLLVILRVCGCECICVRVRRGDCMLTGQVPICEYQAFRGSSLGSTSFLATALAHHPPTTFSPMPGAQGLLYPSPRSSPPQTIVTQGEEQLEGYVWYCLWRLQKK